MSNLTRQEELALVQKRVNKLPALMDKISAAIKLNVLEGADSGAEIEKIFTFMLEYINTGSFYGTFEVKVTGTHMKEPKIMEQTVKVGSIYPD